MIKSYEQFKSKVFNNKDQLRDMLNLLYNVDKLRPMVIDAYNVIDQVEREKKNQRVKNSLIKKLRLSIPNFFGLFQLGFLTSWEVYARIRYCLN